MLGPHFRAETLIFIGAGQSRDRYMVCVAGASNIVRVAKRVSSESGAGVTLYNVAPTDRARDRRCGAECVAGPPAAAARRWPVVAHVRARFTRRRYWRHFRDGIRPAERRFRGIGVMSWVLRSGSRNSTKCTAPAPTRAISEPGSAPPIVSVPATQRYFGAGVSVRTRRRPASPAPAT